MTPPTCQTCGKAEWRHVCAGNDPPERPRIDDRKAVDTVVPPKRVVVNAPAMVVNAPDVVVNMVVNAQPMVVNEPTVVVNSKHGQYADKEARRKYQAEWQRAYRARTKPASP